MTSTFIELEESTTYSVRQLLDTGVQRWDDVEHRNDDAKRRQ